MGKIVKVLSIDGGGIRGIIPAMLLTEIERMVQKPAAEIFDLMAGTSTGGMLALALSVPGEDGKPKYSAKQLIGLYEIEGKTIFSNPASLWQRIPNIRNLTEEKYDEAGIEAVLEKYFGETMLKDALTEVLVTSYDIERRIPFFFRSTRARQYEDYNFLMKHAARATSAAPTFFKPLKLQAQGLQEYFCLVDGSVFTNNPAMCAFVDAKTMFPDADDFMIVSLGTGDVSYIQTYQEAKGWGLIQWAEPLLDIIVHGSDLMADYQMSKLHTPKNGFKRYFRFQAKLNDRNKDIDDTSRMNIRLLKLGAEAVIREKQEELNLLCAQLMEKD